MAAQPNWVRYQGFLVAAGAEVEIDLDRMAGPASDRCKIAVGAVAAMVAVVAKGIVAAEIDTGLRFCFVAAMAEVGMILNSLLASFPDLLPMHLNT